MARRQVAEIETAGNESMLHLAGNIVGILIILVVVAGARAKQAPTVAISVDPEIEAATAVAQREAQAIEADAKHLAGLMAAVDAEASRRFAERAELNVLMTAIDRELAERRSAMDAATQRQYDLQRSLALAKLELEKVEKQKSLVANPAPLALKVENYPTPLSKTVDGKEMHFQLKGGRVTYVPMEELLVKFKAVAPEKIWKLKDLPEMTETIGPMQGFHLRYTLERRDLSTQTYLETGRAGSVIQLQKWELLPVSSSLGETVEQALSSSSLFRAKLDETRPREWTITLWTYPDSFEVYRQLKKELYKLGYPTAGRPLPDGTPIGGSPQGSKSAAE